MWVLTGDGVVAARGYDGDGDNGCSLHDRNLGGQRVF